jgi:hypothetical protein
MLFIITVGTDKFVTRSDATVRYGWFFHQSFDRMPEKQIQVLRIQNNKFKLLFPIHLRVAKVYIFYRILIDTLQRGAFCQFSFRWIYYCRSSKSTGKESGKTNLCALLTVSAV